MPQTARTAWSPLLAGAEAEPFRAVALEIAGAVVRPLLADGADADLGRGAAGVALLLAEVERAGLERDGLPHSTDLLHAAVRAARRRPLPPHLWDGAAGVAFSLTRLRGRGPSAGADRRLLAWVREGRCEEFDVIAGLAGVGVQALELVPDPLGAELLTAIVDALAERAEPDRGGLAWRAASAPEEWGEAFDAGVAHGTPGVAAFLAGAVASGHAPAQARVLLEGGLAWTLAVRLDGGGSSFPYWVGPEGAGGPARLAWCYGDAGVAVAVLLAARALGDADGAREGEEIAAHAAARDDSTAGVVDAGLCHGAAGLAHLFGRLHALTGDPACAQAGRGWLDRTVQMRETGTGVAGFPALVPDGDGLVPTPNPGMLGGAAGVGLALLAACGADEPAWDRALLASHPFL